MAAPRESLGERQKAAAKLGTEKLTPEKQRRRFIEAARDAGTSEDEAEIYRALDPIVKTKT